MHLGTLHLWNPFQEPEIGEKTCKHSESYRWSQDYVSHCLVSVFMAGGISLGGEERGQEGDRSTQTAAPGTLQLRVWHIRYEYLF